MLYIYCFISLLCINCVFGDQIKNKLTSILQNFNINSNTKNIYYNLDYDNIYYHELIYNYTVTNLGAISINTGKFTGRSPKDKYIVKQNPSQNHVWWGHINQPINSSTFNNLKLHTSNHLDQTQNLYIFDGYAGASPNIQKKVRFITESPWQHHFVTNMFIRPSSSELSDFHEDVDFTILNAASYKYTNWKSENLNSEVFIAFNLESKIGLIGGTHYGGEMKKGIFSIMNYLLPTQNILTMHCSANVGSDGTTALFFGLSGTGKTTLSTDPNRKLIGDDEHGWDNNGIFNIEGGCYAKTNGLEKENEPDIYNAIKKNALLENVYINNNFSVNFKNTQITENGRVSYPIYHIPNYEPTSMGTHPKYIFFLCADAFGVLPPISELTNAQITYYFLSGYTAKIPGTEINITEPTAVFSAGFGEPFLTLHPTVYALLLKDKIQKHNSKVYLINTGWTGGPYGIGKRISIAHTRKIINSVLDGTFEMLPKIKNIYFDLIVPAYIPGIPQNVTHPEIGWSSIDAYASQASKLIQMFVKNSKQFTQPK